MFVSVGPLPTTVPGWGRFKEPSEIFDCRPRISLAVFGVARKQPRSMGFPFDRGCCLFRPSLDRCPSVLHNRQGANLLGVCRRSDSGKERRWKVNESRAKCGN